MTDIAGQRGDRRCGDDHADKPLTPTHLKGLLWTDVLVRATSWLTGTRLIRNPRLSNLTAQTTVLWHCLDSAEPDTGWSVEGEAAIGARYVRFHRGRRAVAPRELDTYFARVEADGWIHPAARRLLQLWCAEFDLLGGPDPGLTDGRPLAWTERDVYPDAFLREWERTIRAGQRPPRVKDRVFMPNAGAWERIVA